MSDGALITLVVAIIGGGATLGTALIARYPALTKRLEAVEADQRVLTDYVHELREQIVTLGGTPAPWPPELKV